jgi:hypothetical protein
MLFVSGESVFAAKTVKGIAKANTTAKTINHLFLFIYGYLVTQTVQNVQFR